MKLRSQHSRHEKDPRIRDGIRYPDASALDRPLDPPSTVKKGALIIAAIAAVFGVIFLIWYFDQVVFAERNEQTAFEENINREVNLDLPNLFSFMTMDDAAIMQTLKDSGYTLYEQEPVGTNPNGGFQVIKLPSDVTLAEAGLMYMQGIDNLAPSEVARLLNGSWQLAVSRTPSTELRLHYADFRSGSVELTLQNALLAEGLENATIIDSGVDDVGNTYRTGTLSSGGVTYTWRISIIELSRVYEVRGLPDNIYYVGIRFTV